MGGDATSLSRRLAAVGPQVVRCARLRVLVLDDRHGIFPGFYRRYGREPIA